MILNIVYKNILYFTAHFYLSGEMKMFDHNTKILLFQSLYIILFSYTFQCFDKFILSTEELIGQYFVIIFFFKQTACSTLYYTEKR